MRFQEAWESLNRENTTLGATPSGTGGANSGGGQRVQNNRHRVERGVLGRAGLEGRQKLIQRAVRTVRTAGAARMMMMAVVMAPHRLRRVLNVGELAVLRGIGEIRRKLVELSRRCRITARLGSLRGGLQIRGDLLCDLLILGWVRLLKLLQRIHQLDER